MTEQVTNFDINVPETLRAGHYADFASIWHNQDTFVLDFIALAMPPQTTPGPDGQPITRVPADVVSRVRIPASQVWEIMKALEQQYSAWEAENKRS